MTGEKLVIGKVIKMPCMRRGVCAYPERKITLLITQETLEAMAETSHGIPVIIDHAEKDELIENIETLTVGRVADMHYNPDTDEWLAHFIVDTQEAVDKLEAGWGVSTAYERVEDGPGGTYNAVPYDVQVNKARYTHLAIVERPRYEMAVNPEFFNSSDTASRAGTVGANNNAKGNYMSKVGKIFRTVREMLNGADGENYYVAVNGEDKKLSDLVNEMGEFEKKEAAKNELAKKRLGDDDEIEYNGTKMSVKNFVEKYNSYTKNVVEEGEGEGEKKEEKKPEPKEEKNEVETKEEAKREKDEGEVKNSLSDAKKAAAAKAAQEKAEEKARFDAVHNSAMNPPAEIDDGKDFKTITERVEEGRALYGSKK